MLVLELCKDIDSRLQIIPLKARGLQKCPLARFILFRSVQRLGDEEKKQPVGDRVGNKLGMFRTIDQLPRRVLLGWVSRARECCPACGPRTTDVAPCTDACDKCHRNGCCKERPRHKHICYLLSLSKMFYGHGKAPFSQETLATVLAVVNVIEMPCWCSPDRGIPDISMSYEIVKIPKVRITAQLGDKAGQIKRALGARLDGFRCGQHP